MATMNQVIEYVDRVKLNTYNDEDKYRWMRDLEGMVISSVLTEENESLSPPVDGDAELLVPEPYSEIYAFYVMAMIDFHNREYDEYNNTVLLYMERLEAFKAWYIQNNRPKSYKKHLKVMG